MAGSPTRTSTASERRHLGLRAAALLVVLAWVTGCGAGGASPDPGPFTLSVVNASRHDATVTWTGARQGGGSVGACEVVEFTFDDGLWVVGVAGAADAAQFPMRVETATGGARTRTVAIDATGRIDIDARVPLREPPCPIE